MAKIHDYNTIATEVDVQMYDVAPDLVSYIGDTATIWCVMGIYLCNNLTSGYGQDFYTLVPLQVNGHPSKVSVIAYADGVSVIIDSQMSRYQDSLPLCGYEDLAEDIHAILMYIQTAIDRINARG